MSVVVNIRGTSGSGKSTLARRVMALYGEPLHKQMVAGRKLPISYDLRHPRLGHSNLRVLGHYENPCGGGDTISQGLDFVHGLVLEGVCAGYDVLYEGLIIGSDMSRIVGLSQEGATCGVKPNVLVVFLDTPLEVCLARVNTRRAERAARLGKEYTPVNPKSTTDKHRGLERGYERLAAMGVPCVRTDADEAFTRIRAALGLLP